MVGAMTARYLGRDIDRYDFGSGLGRARETIDIFTNAGLRFEPAKRVTNSRCLGMTESSCRASFSQNDGVGEVFPSQKHDNSKHIAVILNTIAPT